MFPRSHGRSFANLITSNISRPTGAQPHVSMMAGCSGRRAKARGNRRAKLNLGSMGFASQYQQRPAPAGGALFKHEWWKYWRVLPQLHRIIMAMDTAYEEGDDNSFSNCDVWGFAISASSWLITGTSACSFLNSNARRSGWHRMESRGDSDRGPGQRPLAHPRTQATRPGR